MKKQIVPSVVALFTLCLSSCANHPSIPPPFVLYPDQVPGPDASPSPRAASDTQASSTDSSNRNPVVTITIHTASGKLFVQEMVLDTQTQRPVPTYISSFVLPYPSNERVKNMSVSMTIPNEMPSAASLTVVPNLMCIARDNQPVEFPLSSSFVRLEALTGASVSADFSIESVDDAIGNCAHGRGTIQIAAVARLADLDQVGAGKSSYVELVFPIELSTMSPEEANEPVEAQLTSSESI
jgi:hypothetical protein